MSYFKLKEGEALPKADLKDKKIIRLLSANSRLSATAISKKIGVSRDAVIYRIKKMEASGIIQGYPTIVDVKKFGYDAYHLFIQLNQLIPEEERKFIDKLKENPKVRAILRFSGKYDLEIAVVAKDLDDFDKTLQGILNDCNDSINDYDLLGITKNFVNNAVPKSFIEAPAEDTSLKKNKLKEKLSKSTSNEQSQIIDEKDEKILQKLSADASAPMHAISSSAGVSADAAIYRINKMKESGIIVRHTLAINHAKLGYDMYVVLINMPNLYVENEKKLKEILSQDKNIIWATKAVGKYNILVYFCTEGTEALHKTMIKIRNSFPKNIKTYETMLVYNYYKYTYLPQNLKLI